MPARDKSNTVTGNTADKGGGIFVALNSSPAITGNTITGNTADYVGGGIAVEYDSSPTIMDNTITGNTADEGGGIWVSHCSVLHLSTPDDNIYRDNVPDDIHRSRTSWS